MSIYQKQIESEKLNNDVEAWLAQNIITELPMGFTNFKDGNIPLDRTRKTVISEKESIAKIEATNKAVREGKQLSASKQKRVLEVQQRKQEKEVLKQEQRRIVAEFFSKAKTGDITALGKMVGMPAETLRKVRDGVYLLKPERREKLYSVISAFKYGEIQAAKNQFKLVEFKSTDESSRKMLITTLAKWAQEKGETRFQGKCKNHGWTEYETKYGKTYCLACRTKHKEVSEAYKQNMLNSAERVKAIQAGEKTYFAICPNHGRTEYQVLSNKRGICIECRRNRQGMARIDGLRAAREEAIKKGETRFTFNCHKCGGNEYRVTKAGSHECLGCKQKRYEAKAKPRLQIARPHMLVNRERRKEAIEQGLKDFTGLCPRHGETRFRVMTNPAYKCVKCNTEQNTRSQKVNRDRYTNHPHTQELITFILESRRGTARRLSEYLGISPTTMSHYTNGRAVLPDHHYEKFLEFKARLQGAAA